MAVNIDIDNIATDLNNKADKDLTNTVGALSSSAKEYFTKISLPSSKYINLTLGASGTTYTAPANGYFYINKVAGVSSHTYIDLQNSTSGFSCRSNSITSTLTTQAVLLPVRKNDIAKVTYNVEGTTNSFKFIYAVGSESEV